MVHNVPDVTDEAGSDRGAERARLALGVVSLLVHAGVVWLLPPADLRPRQDPNVLLAPVELVEWEAPEEPAPPRADAPVEPPDASAPVEPTPSEPTPPPEPTRTRPILEPRGPEASTGSPTPSEPAPVPEPADGGSDSAALPITGFRSTSRGSITSPRLPGSAARRIGGDHVGAAPPPAAGTVDGEPQTLAEAGFLRNKKGDIVYQDPLGHFKATLMPDGRVKFRDFAVARGTIRSGGKVAGMSEAIRSAQGKDLFYLEKKKLLARTEKLRLAMAVKWAEAQVDHRLKGLYRDLLEIWSDAERTEVERREQLFQRWDECVEAMSVKVDGFGDAAKSSLDALREKAGGEARASIEAFIRRHLPKGSEDAYTPEELRELNRRRHSEERFDPYAQKG
jgi:hypothetical protein